MKKLLLMAVALLCAVSMAQGPVTPISQPHQTYVDQGGAPCAGCALFSYTAGSTIPKPTYKDAGGTVPNTNPIVLSVQGGADIWVTKNTAYKFVLKNTSGTTLWTVDNVTTTGSNSIQANPGGDQTITQPPGSDFNVNTSGGGSFNYNGSEVLTVDTLPDTVVLTDPPATQFVLKTLGLKDVIAGNNNILTSFGDSNTVGFGLPTPTTQGYVYLIAAHQGWTLFNKAVSSSMCGDQSLLAFQETPHQGSNYSWNLGYNDMRVNGSNAVKVIEFHACTLASLARLAIPNAQFIPAQLAQPGSGLPGCLYAGTWSNATVGGIPIKFSGANGSAITCVTPPGQTAYVYAIHQVNNTSNQFTISVDGIAQPCIGGENVCFDDHTWTEFATTTTALGQTYFPLGIRLSNLNAANDYHTIVLTVVSAGSSGMHVLGVSASSSGSGGIIMPNVIAAEVPRMNAAGYAAGFIGSNASLALYNEHIHTVASELAQDGLQIRQIDTSSAEVLDPNNAANMQADNVHFSIAGHQAIANAYISELSPLGYPRDRGAGMQFRNLSPYRNSLYAGGVPALASSGEMGSTTGASSGLFTMGSDHCGYSRESGTVYQVGGHCSTGIALFQFGGASNIFPAFVVNPGGALGLQASKADNSGTIPITASNLYTATTPVTTTGLGAGITTFDCAPGFSCTSKAGTLRIVSSTFTLGTIGTVVWPFTPAAQICMIGQYGGAAWYGFGSTVPTTTGFSLTNNNTMVGTTQFATYSCQPAQ
jgi:lysophospholipase L1-like esterase